MIPIIASTYQCQVVQYTTVCKTANRIRNSIVNNEAGGLHVT